MFWLLTDLLWDWTLSAWIAPIQGIQVIWGHDRTRGYRQKWQEQEPNDDKYIGRTCQVRIVQVHITTLLFKNALARDRGNTRGQRIWLRLEVIYLFQARKKQCVHVFWWFYKPVFLTVGRHFLRFLWSRFSLVYDLCSIKYDLFEFCTNHDHLVRRSSVY